MRITKYMMELDDNLRNVLVKENSSNYPNKSLSNPQNIVDMLNELYHLNKKAEEYVYMIAFNTRGRPLGVFEISHGTVNICPCVAREIYMRAILCGATYIVLAHNHPSQVTIPSESDIKICDKLSEAGKLMGIDLMDNLIIGGNEYLSFREKGLF